MPSRPFGVGGSLPGRGDRHQPLAEGARLAEATAQSRAEGFGIAHLEDTFESDRSADRPGDSCPACRREATAASVFRSASNSATLATAVRLSHRTPAAFPFPHGVSDDHLGVKSAEG